MRNRYALGIVASVLIVLISTWALFRDSFSSSKPSYTHLYCPGCGQEIVYDSSKAWQKCPFCVQNGGEDPEQLIPAIGRGEMRVLASGGTAFGRTMVLIVIIVVAIQADLLLLYMYRQDRRRQEAAYKNRVLVCRCPFCQRKIGYTARKIGEGVACPRCKTAFMLPPDDGTTSTAGQEQLPPAAS